MTRNSFFRFNSKIWNWVWLQDQEIDTFLVHNQFQLHIMFNINIDKLTTNLGSFDYPFVLIVKSLAENLVVEPGESQNYLAVCNDFTMGSQRVRHDWTTELNDFTVVIYFFIFIFYHSISLSMNC